MPLRVDLTTGMNQNRADAINYVAQQAVANPNRRYVAENGCEIRAAQDPQNGGVLDLVRMHAVRP